jgi:small ligand-binding sensory domain FIST
MRWASALSETPATRDAVADATARVKRELGDEAPQLVALFASPHHASDERLPSLVKAAFPSALLFGCSGAGVIGAGREVEARPALSLTAAVLPDVRLVPLHVDQSQLPADGAAWRARFGLPTEAAPQFLVLADPFTLEAESLVDGLDQAYPEARKVGGLASGGRFPGESALYLAGELYRGGAVCVAMAGNITVETIVAQGCRPIGRPMVVTRSRANVIIEIDRRRPAEVLRELYESLSPRDQELFQHSLFLGIEMRDDEIEVRAGEFLVRNLVGMDPQTSALAVAALPRPWQVIQFLLRDANTASEDLASLLDRYCAEGARPSGALLFSCLGRGVHLFGAPDHDTRLFQDRLGPVPLGGFFCNGEIGPVGGSTFLHGYTSAFGLFRQRD